MAALERGLGAGHLGRGGLERALERAQAILQFPELPAVCRRGLQFAVDEGAGERVHLRARALDLGLDPALDDARVVEDGGRGGAGRAVRDRGRVEAGLHGARARPLARAGLRLLARRRGLRGMVGQPQLRLLE